MANDKPLSLPALKVRLRNFVYKLYRQLQPAESAESWDDFRREIRRRVNGKMLGIQLNQNEYEEYLSCVREMCRAMGESNEIIKGPLSRRAAEQLLGTAIVESLFDPSTEDAYESDRFQKSLDDTIDELIAHLEAGPKEWTVNIPILNCSLAGRRWQLGSVRFVNAGPTFLRRIRREANKMINGTTNAPSVKRDLKRKLGDDFSEHWRAHVIAEVSVMAFDDTAASDLGRAIIARTVDIVNFLADIEFPHSPAMYLSGTAGSGVELSILLSDHFMSQPWERTGPAPVELHRLRREANRIRLRFFTLLAGYETLTWRQMVVLAATRQCAQARLAVDPASKFLHYVVALDAMLPTRSSAREMSLFVAHVLGRTVLQRESIKTLVQRLYNIRNDVVHGEVDFVLDSDLDNIRRVAISMILRVGISSIHLNKLSTKTQVRTWMTRQLLQ